MPYSSEELRFRKAPLQTEGTPPPRYSTAYRYSAHPVARMIDRAARMSARRSLIITCIEF